MAQIKDMHAKLNENTLQPVSRFKDLINRADYQARFDEVLGKKKPSFIASLLSLYNGSKALQGCDPKSILSSAMIAATLDLPINQNLGFAYIIPYKGLAQFQMGYKGFIQLAIRTGQYKTINATELYEDEIAFWNPITAEIEFTDSSKWKQRNEGREEKIVGYVSFFRLHSGFEKFIYMTKEQVAAHARRYSQSYGKEFGAWKTHTKEMSVKTPLKLNLSKYGILSIDMQKALEYDQGVVTETTEGEKVSYPDGNDQPIETALEAVKRDEPGDAIEPA